MKLSSVVNPQNLRRDAINASSFCSNLLLLATLNVALPNDLLAATAQTETKLKLNLPEQRYTDQKIAEDQRQFATLQERIRLLNATGKHPINEYAMAKAQCWLDVSRHEYARNDRSAFPQEALEQSEQIVSILEKNGEQLAATTLYATPHVNQAKKLREDLWEKIEALKKSAGFHCVMAEVACSEVELVHAGNEYNQQQWRHAKPYVAVAETKVSQAENLAAECAAKLPVSLKPSVAETESKTVEPKSNNPQVPLSVKLATVTAVEQYTLGADALFRFNRGDLSGMLPQGKNALDDLIRKMKMNFGKIERIQISGFTDHFGSVAYNEALSRKRAETVALYIEKSGVTGIISAEGKGPKNPVKSCDRNLSQHTLVQCLQPNRRVELVVVGIRN